MRIGTLDAGDIRLGLAGVFSDSGFDGRGRAPRLLAAFLVCALAQALNALLIGTGGLRLWPHLSQLHVPFMFASGPLLFLYVRAALRTDSDAGRRDWLHFVPALAWTLMLMPYYVMSGTDKQAFLTAALEQYPRSWEVRQGLQLLQTAAYLAACLALFGRATPDGRVRAGRPLRALLLVSLIVWIGASVRYWFAYYPSTAILPVLLALLAVAAVTLVSASPARSTRASGAYVPEPDDLRCIDALEQAMRERRLFEDPNLTLETLAHAIGTSHHHLSRVINRHYGRSMPDYVTSYRIDAVKQRLAEDAAHARSIWAIAESCGFRSRAAFNTAFRKLVGITPSEYRRAQARS